VVAIEITCRYKSRPPAGETFLGPTLGWAEHDPSTIGNRLIAMVFHGPAHGWAIGQAGTIIAWTA
jgi:hypothetical protein